MFVRLDLQSENAFARAKLVVEKASRGEQVNYFDIKNTIELVGRYICPTGRVFMPGIGDPFVAMIVLYEAKGRLTTDQIKAENLKVMQGQTPELPGDRIMVRRQI